MRDGLETLRRAGAKARHMLRAAAAESWGVPIADVEAKHHELIHTPSGRRAGYGGTVKSFDDQAAKAVPGVETIIRLPDVKLPAGFSPLGGVAVIATNTWAAIKGRNALTITWDDGPNHTYDSQAYRRLLEGRVSRPTDKVVANRGDVATAKARAKRVVKASYYTPHLAHAPMEPPAAIANVADGKCEVWACTQNPQGARDEIAKALGMDAADVTVHVTLLGGGFGRKSKPVFAPALCNAIFAATGKRIRELPIANQLKTP